MNVPRIEWHHGQQQTACARSKGRTASGVTVRCGARADFALVTAGPSGRESRRALCATCARASAIGRAISMPGLPTMFGQEGK